MLLTLTTTHQPATDLGYLLHKHPDRLQEFPVTGGKSYVFYPEATDSSCTACLLIELDTIDLVRTLKGPHKGKMLQHYVNDRPYVASSLTTSTLSKVFGSALNGQCKDRPALVTQAIPLTVSLSVLKAKGGPAQIERMFGPLGYEMEIERFPLDPLFPQWGESPYYALKLSNQLPLSTLLNHLYVLLPVFDDEKHYWVDEQEVRKLLKAGKGWLEQHPESEWITRRYLRNIGSLTRSALHILSAAETESDERKAEAVQPPKPKGLHGQRLEAAEEQLLLSGAESVLDLGCGEGKLLQRLLKRGQFQQMLGIDVSIRALQKAKERLHLDEMSPRMRQRIELAQGSVTYRDQRMEGYDAAALIEVIEHLEPERLPALERVVFEFAKPKTVILTTPNAEYNAHYENLAEDKFRHEDHRFEWTRAEFQDWVSQVCKNHGYAVRIFPIGEEDPVLGASSQMAVFTLQPKAQI